MTKTQTVDFNKLDDIPMMPVVVTKAIQVINDPRSGAKDLTDLIINDQILAARLLKVANSAYYGLPNKINNLNRAITLIGFNEITRMIAPIILLDTFKSLQRNDYFSSTNFWVHSLAVAGACEILVEKINKPLDIGEARVVGLLHDIGRMIMVEIAPVEFEKAMRIVQRGGNILDAESAILGQNHAEVGALVTEKWNLPESITNIIKYHHNSDNAPADSYLAEVVSVADYLANHLQMRSLVVGEPIEIPRHIKEKYIHDEEDFDILLTRLETEVEKAKTMLSMIKD